MFCKSEVHDPNYLDPVDGTLIHYEPQFKQGAGKQNTVLPTIPPGYRRLVRSALTNCTLTNRLVALD